MTETVKEEGPQLKRINIKSGKFTAGDETYYIQPNLSVIRYVEYLKRVPRLTFHTTFKGMYDTLHKIYNVTASGNDMIYAIQQARELSWNQLDAIQRFDEHELPDIIDFVALFCNKEGEDVGQFDISIHENKKTMIAKEGYAIQDFFTLAFHLIESFSEGYQKIQETIARITEGGQSSRSSQRIKATS